MYPKLDDDEYLQIQLLHYTSYPEGKERYYFLEMSTLQATTLLSGVELIEAHDIIAYNDDDLKFERKLATIKAFNDFFINNPDFYIQNCTIQLTTGMTINSHDDGEVCIEYPKKEYIPKLIDDIFEKFQLDKSLIDELKKKKGHYLVIDAQSNIIGDFESFDDYLDSQKS